MVVLKAGSESLLVHMVIKESFKTMFSHKVLFILFKYPKMFPNFMRITQASCLLENLVATRSLDTSNRSDVYPLAIFLYLPRACKYLNLLARF